MTTKYLIAYVGAFVTLLVLDGIWLGLVSANFYKANMGHLMAESPRWGVAAAFYLVYLIGVLFFAVNPALASGEWKTALLYGALFGFFVYFTYDMTNLATLKGWSISLTIVDIAWGTFLTACAAVAGFAAASRWG